MADNLPWLDGRLTAGDHAARVKTNRQLDPTSPLAISIIKIVTNKIISNSLLKSYALIYKVHSILLSRSEIGDGYGWHVDNPFSKYGRRDISFTLFLSNPSEYDGGELVFQSIQTTNSIRLSAGHIILYPSSLLHCVQPILGGIRLVCVGWIESYVQSSEDRSLLFNLEAGAKGLLARHGRSDELDLIFQSYANAVRRFSS
ncbi:Fe2+-dependent dioxygenase [Synechococcus sp. M16CYN]